MLSMAWAVKIFLKNCKNIYVQGDLTFGAYGETAYNNCIFRSSGVYRRSWSKNHKALHLLFSPKNDNSDENDPNNFAYHDYTNISHKTITCIKLRTNY